MYVKLMILEIYSVLQPKIYATRPIVSQNAYNFCLQEESGKKYLNLLEPQPME